MAELMKLDNQLVREVKYMIVDFAPSAEAFNNEMAFEDPVGRLLRSYLDRSSISIQDCYFTYLHKFPLLYQVTDGLKKISVDHLHKEIAYYKPDVVITLGNETFNTITSKKNNVTYRAYGHTIQVQGDDGMFRDTWIIPIVNPKAVINGEIKWESNIMATLTSVKDKIDPLPEEVVDYKSLNTITAIEEYVDFLLKLWKNKQLDEFLVIDLETSNLSPFETTSHILGLAITHQSHQSYFVPFKHFDSPFQDDSSLDRVAFEMNRLLSSGIPVSNQNMSFDQKWIRKFFKVEYMHIVGDSMVADYAVNNASTPHNLDSLIARILGLASHKYVIDDYMKTLKNKEGINPIAGIPWKTFSYAHVPYSILVPYTYKDTDRTYRITKILETEARRIGVYNFYRHVLCECRFEFLVDMEYDGAYVNTAELGTVEVFYKELIERNEQVLTSNPYFLLAVQDYYGHTIDYSTMTFTAIAKASYDGPGITKPITIQGGKNGLKRTQVTLPLTDILNDWISLKSVKFMNLIMYKHMGLHYQDWGTDKAALNELVIQLGENNSELLALTGKAHDKIWRDSCSVFLKELIKYRKNVKLYDSYVRDLPKFIKAETRCVHPTFSVGLATGRVSNFSPALQTFPSYCLTGDTKVSLLNGTEQRIDSFTEGDEFWVYGCKPNGEIVPSKAKALGVTKIVDELVEVTLDNGESVRCTPDHRFMMRDGSYTEAQYLESGDSLMPLYRRVNEKGYEEVKHNDDDSWEKTHQMSARLIYGDKMYHNPIKGEGPWVIHHKDFNKRNNDPPNFDKMTFLAHLTYHQEHRSLALKAKWKDPVFRKNQIETSRQRFLDNWKDPEYRKEHSKRSSLHMKNMWKTRTEEMLGYCSEGGKVAGKINIEAWNAVAKTLDYEEWYDLCYGAGKQKEVMDRLNKDPNFILKRNKGASKHMIELNKKQWKDEEFRKLRSKSSSAVMHRLNSNQEFREANSLKIQLRNKDPKFIILVLASKILKECSVISELGELTSYVQFRRLSYKHNIKKYSLDSIEKYFGSFKVFKSLLTKELNFDRLYNHKVASIRIIKSDSTKVYDIQTETSNFAVSDGVFVHNSRAKDVFSSRFEGGGVCSVDFGQMELRVVAMVSGDQGMKRAFKDGIDIHTATTADIFNLPINEVPKHLRRHTKTIVFGILYGRSARATGNELGMELEEAQALIDKFYAARPELEAWIEEMHQSMNDTNYVWTPLKQRLLIYEEGAFDWSSACRHSVNYPIQGTASYICMIAGKNIMREIKKRKMKTVIFNFVHDSLLFDIYPGELEQVHELCIYYMEEHPSKEFDFINDIPLVVDFEYGQKWGRGVHVNIDTKVGTLEAKGSIPKMGDSIPSILSMGYVLDNTEYVGVEDNEETYKYFFKKTEALQETNDA